MPLKRPGMAGLALDLDGCRFGDSPPRRDRRRDDRGGRHHEKNDEGRRGPSSVSSPLSTHHRDHVPQRGTLPSPSSSSPGRRPSDRRYDDDHPSPMGGTYRAEGLSIGRDFLRFRGSTLGQGLGADDFDVVECVGRGACSSVWKARRKSGPDAAVGGGAGATKLYALKLFSLRDPERRSMLVRELGLLCAFRCECLVGLEGAFVDDEGRCGGDCTLVLEFMDRGSLGDLTACDEGIDRRATKINFIGSPDRQLTVPATPGAVSSPLFRGLSPPSAEKHRRVPEHAIAAIAYQMIWGLGYLHHEGVLHRDIKPANVLVSSSGRVKLADFGIVSRRRESSSSSGAAATPMSRTVVGTTRYMSPERLRGAPYAGPSDVWSAGLVLLELARGDSPFGDATSVVELVQTLDECEMGEFIPGTTSDGLREILLGCLDRSPENRMPAPVLLSSPWFELLGIRDVEDASSSMKAYLDRAYPPL